MTLQYRPTDGKLLRIESGPDAGKLARECCCRTCCGVGVPRTISLTVSGIDAASCMAPAQGAYTLEWFTSPWGPCAWEGMLEVAPNEWALATLARIHDAPGEWCDSPAYWWLELGIPHGGLYEWWYWSKATSGGGDYAGAYTFWGSGNEPPFCPPIGGTAVIA